MLHFQKCVARDFENEQKMELFRSQFAKAHYNIGMIFDKLGKIELASSSYLKSLQMCVGDPEGKMTETPTYKKAGTNYAVTLEKLGKRKEAAEFLIKLKPF